MTTRKIDKQDTREGGAYIAVTVEQEIGHLYIDPNGGEPVAVAAMRVMGEHHDTTGERGVYRVPMPDGSTLTVSVHRENTEIDPLARWLAIREPALWDAWQAEQGQPM